MGKCKRLWISAAIIFMTLIIIQLIPMNQIKVRAATKVAISKDVAYLLPGETLQLELTGTTKKASWSSSSTGIATVNKNSKVTANSLKKVKRYTEPMVPYMREISWEREEKLMIHTKMNHTLA